MYVFVELQNVGIYIGPVGRFGLQRHAFHALLSDTSTLGWQLTPSMANAIFFCSVTPREDAVVLSQMFAVEPPTSDFYGEAATTSSTAGLASLTVASGRNGRSSSGTSGIGIGPGFVPDAGGGIGVGGANNDGDGDALVRAQLRLALSFPTFLTALLAVAHVFFPDPTQQPSSKLRLFLLGKFYKGAVRLERHRRAVVDGLTATSLLDIFESTDEIDSIDMHGSAEHEHDLDNH